MAKPRFIGAAQAISQIDELTVSGTFAAGETLTIKVAEKSVTYTCGASETTTTVATELTTLCNASSDAEFKEITWESASAVITATSDAGVPVTITCSDTAASGAIALVNQQAATGPNHWDNAANWSTGAVPVNSDEVFIEETNAAVLYGLPTSALSLAKFVHKLGQLGLPQRNVSGYAEYRTKRAQITCTDVQIGKAAGNGPTLCRLDLDTSNATVVVFGSTARSDIPCVDLLINHASATVSAISGQVGIAASGDETSTVGTVRAAAGSAVQIGPGVTLTTMLSAGNSEVAASVTNLTVDQGNTTLVGTATVGTLEVRDGTLINKSTGTITTANVGPGVLDCAQDIRTRTITTLSLRKNGTLRDPYKTVTITNFSLGSDADALTAS